MKKFLKKNVILGNSFYNADVNHYPLVNYYFSGVYNYLSNINVIITYFVFAVFVADELANCNKNTGIRKLMRIIIPLVLYTFLYHKQKIVNHESI